LIPSVSNFGSLKSTETCRLSAHCSRGSGFSNFGSLKSTETDLLYGDDTAAYTFSNFGSLKSTETKVEWDVVVADRVIQQFRLVEEH